MEIKEGYTRVSSIIGQWHTFSHIDPDVLAKKCAIGTRVHEAIEQDNNEGTICLPREEAQYFLSYRNWKEAVNPEFVHTEKRLYCDRLKITGAMDAMVKLPGSTELVIVDYKTSAVVSAKTWPLQACFYNYLAVMNGFVVSPRVLFIKLDKEGKEPKVIEYQYTRDLMNVCISALTCYRHMND